MSSLALAVAGVALAAPAARAAAPDPGAITAGALAGVTALQRDDGLFDDPTGRVVGSSGLPTLAFGALHADETIPTHPRPASRWPARRSPAARARR